MFNFKPPALRQGADVNAKDAHGQTGLILAITQEKQYQVADFIRAGANVNLADNDGCTALMYAAKAGHALTVKQLLDAGADVNHTNRQGKTAKDIVLKILRQSHGHTKLADAWTGGALHSKQIYTTYVSIFNTLHRHETLNSYKAVIDDTQPISKNISNTLAKYIHDKTPKSRFTRRRTPDSPDVTIARDIVREVQAQQGKGTVSIESLQAALSSNGKSTDQQLVDVLGMLNQYLERQKTDVSALPSTTPSMS